MQPVEISLQLMIFLGIFGFSTLTIILVFLFGEILEGLGHAIDGMFSFFHLDFMDMDMPDHGGGSSGLYSFKALLVFIIVFSAVGTMTTFNGAGPFASTSWGIVAGFAAGVIYGLFARFLYKQQSSSVVKDDFLLEKVGTLTTGIPVSGVGQLMVTLSTGNVLKTARSTDNTAIPYGSRVKVVEVVGGEAVVEKL